ncbi:MAG TPA: CapA family protein, partial [Anaerolineales bacterium]
MAAMQIRSIPQRRNAPLWRCWRRTALGLACILVTACSSLAPVANIQSPGLRALTPTFTPFQPLLATGQPERNPASAGPAPGTPQPAAALPAETAVPTPAAVSLWVDPRLPAVLRQGLVLPAGIVAADHPEQASMRLEPGGANPVSHWIYALVAPFPEKTDSVTVDTLQSAWKGQSDGPFAGRPLLVDDSTLAIFAGLWGPPGAGAVHTLPASDLLNFAWEHRPAWAIVPFEAVEPRWKVLAVGGLSPLHKAFDPAAYALTVPISLVGQTNARQSAAELSAFVPPTNRDPARLTVVALTGTTALVRATAYTMEQKGITYPGQDVRDILRSADLTHVSNEVPFAEDCPYPNPVQPDMRFCSDPRYIGFLEDVGTDIVELTGDHFQDWGVPAMRYTLDLYRELGWKYYGGGENLEDGRKPLLVEHNGNRLAFIGCNGKRGSFAQAAAEHPGAVPCDYDWLDQEVTRLRAEGYLPI